MARSTILKSTTSYPLGLITFNFPFRCSDITAFFPSPDRAFQGFHMRSRVQDLIFLRTDLLRQAMSRTIIQFPSHMSSPQYFLTAISACLEHFKPSSFIY